MLKRYWKLILLVSVIVLTISSFYIHGSFATSKLPTFHIKHQSGDSVELEDLDIQGYYHDDQAEAYLQINKDGTNYDRPQSYVSFLSQENYLPDEVIRLQKEYRNFMRNKQEGNHSFFENDEILVYANIDMDFKYINGKSNHKFKFEIETLHKKTKEKNQFTIPVPVPENYEYLFVEDVQITDSGHLKVFTRNSVMSDAIHHDEMHYYPNHDEIHVYSFDLDKQALENDEVIQHTEIESDGLSLDIFPVFSNRHIGPIEYIVFKGEVREVKAVDDDGFVDEELIENNLIVYHVETGEQRNLDLPADIGEEYNPVLYDEPTIYFEKHHQNQYEVIKYNIKNEEIEIKQTFDLKLSNENFSPQMEIKDDKLYIISSFKSNEVEAYVQIGDINNGDMIYEGAIELAEDEEGRDYELELYY